ncbi:hypothetical protein [Prauserella cavernicola]|uniref:Helix-turn-helix domain-containing protein n=1 Tax=Prauserella cavernicola TaxID=2800127 RepID=A0A934QVF9_9PSEU|nr:hypothetical protein [Prauserella cavernicola]MBK1787113.1 hypothetical protein [Prauserella cavernicola]
MNGNAKESISEALERLALTLGENGAVPVPELVRALERAAERLRTRSVSTELPHDLVTQAEASRAVGVSRQAVNQWVRNGLVRSFVRDGGSSRYAPEVSLSEIAIAANRRTREVPFSAPLRKELLEFLLLLEQGSTEQLARALRDCIEDDNFPGEAQEQIRVLREFVLASMGDGEQQHEFTAAGVTMLAGMSPRFEVDTNSPFGKLLDSLDLLVHSTDGTDGFDSPATAIVGLLGAATVGAQYPGSDADVGRTIADTAEKVWGADWTARLYDAAFHIGELRPTPLTRYTASLTYLDNNRFLRQAQASGVSITYARGPGPILPERFYGAHILADILSDARDESAVWRWSPEHGPRERPIELPSTDNPFRVFHYEYGLIDSSIYGIRRYCFSAADARDKLRAQLDGLSSDRRSAYLELVTSTLTRTLREPYVELVSIARREDFDWWKDHIIRASEREILIGLRDERARRTAHGLLVQTSLLPKVVEAADSDGSLRERLRIYVKNLEFDVVDVRYHDDVRRDISRIVKAGGRRLTEDEARALAETEIRSLLD